MPRPRVPLEKARSTGRIKHDPKRFKNRREPHVGEPIGPAPDWLSPSGKAAWRTLDKEIPWLNRSHRSLVGIASKIQGQMHDGEDVSVNGLNLLRLILGQMGATPADSSKVVVPEEPDNADPSAKYF